MKDNIILFVIGVLFGAVIATGAFYVYTTTSSKSCDCSSQSTQMSGQTPPEMPSGENGQPPEKPSEDNTQERRN